MSEKLCVFCENMQNDSYQQYESGGGGNYFYCAAGHFNNLSCYIDKEWRDIIHQAKICPDYKEAK